MKINFDMDALTLGDLEDFEDIAGRGLVEAMQDYQNGKVSMKELTGLVWICTRVENPEFTLAEARKVKLSDLDELEIEVVSPDPTPGDV